MGGHQLAAMEDLHGLRGDPRLHLLPQQLERHRVEMLRDLDVVVEVDAAALPLGVFVRGRWQRQQGWPIDLLKQDASRRAPAAQCPVIQLCRQLADRGVQLT